MSIRRKILIGAVVLFIVSLLFAAFVLPSILRNVAVEKIEEATGRKASITKVAINPLTLSARVTDFRLAEKGATTTFASFSSVRVSVSPASLVRRALIVSRIEVASPYVNIVRSAANTYNFTDLVTPKKDAKPSKPFPFSLNNIVIRGGAIDFHDLAAHKPTNHTVRRMEIAVPFFSTIPYLADKYVAPRFSAVINGAELSATGKLKPLAKTMETSLNLKLRDFDLPYYLAYLPVAVPVGIRSGKLSTDLELSYQVSARNKPDLGLAGRLELTGLDVREKSGAPLIALHRLAAQINKAAIFGQNFDLATLELDGTAAYLERYASGQWNFERLKGKQTAPATPKPDPDKDKADKQAPKPTLKLSALKFTNGSIQFNDRLPPGGFQGKLEKVTLSLSDFSMAAGQVARWNFACRSGRNESLEATGTAAVEPLAVSADLTVRGIALGAYYPYLAGVLTAPVAGSVDLTGHLAFDRNAGLTLERLAVTGNNLASTFAPGEGIRMNQLVIGGGSINLKEQNATVELVDMKGVSCQISREKDGTLSPMHLLRTPAGTAPATATGVTPKGKETKPFTYKLRKVGGSGIGITFTDRAQKDAAVINLRRLQFTLANITGPRFGSIPFTLTSQVGKQGSVRANGTVLPSPLKLKGNVELKKLALRDFEAYLPENLNLYVADGTIDTRMSIALAKEPGRELSGSYAGTLGVRSFYCLDTVESEDLLKWESLQLDDIKGTITPFSLAIREVALNNVYSRIVVNKDGTLNLQNLTKKEAASTPPQTAVAPPPSMAPPSPAPATAERQVRIGAVTIQEGTLAFSDRHLPGGFATTFYHLGGRVSGLSSEENRFADVDLRGNLENQSPLQITGTLNPLRNDLFADLKVSFTDIDLTPVTPYSGTYLGYTVEKGKLSLDLKYLIDKKALTSENKVFIDQFTFGKKVESDRATSLPVRLAVALLKDRKGEIHLDLPVTGRTDDPKFSVWSVVLQMLKNLLVKAATSPLALLSAFGGADDFSSVGFAPGSATLVPAEQEKLLKLAGSLNERPSINLEISGFVDRNKDREGYRTELLNKKLKGEKFLALVKSKQNRPDQTPDNVEVLPDEYSRLLKEVYRKEKFPKPRNVIGFVKDLPDDEMKKLIITNTTVGDEQLGTLARDRATAVQNFLLEKGKLPAERLFLKRDDIYKAPSKEGERGSRVEFGANVK
ncbi:DUF748 domain-containing protein [Geobacter sp. AOG1]|uniref:DUF748 domain-containing protein n=1 Tax=Geobacter sp. AOG1 TaxID=1566346 RepID=UPI001CC82231|nr:DUF748 domain-containing protein [Geobacter sp. AOG1]GFE58882.1 flagellar motor protein MotB [Geobacter sp. AOG1]